MIGTDGTAVEESAVVEESAAVGCTGWTTESTVKYRVAVIVLPNQQVGRRLCLVMGAVGMVVIRTIAAMVTESVTRG